MTIFAKILNGEIPADKIHEDDLCIAFRDIAPRRRIMFWSFRASPSCSMASAEQDAALLGRLMLVAAKVARDLGLDSDGYRLVTNVGPDGGQSVFHLHIRLGRPLGWPPGESPPAGRPGCPGGPCGERPRWRPRRQLHIDAFEQMEASRKTVYTVIAVPEYSVEFGRPRVRQFREHHDRDGASLRKPRCTGRGRGLAEPRAGCERWTRRHPAGSGHREWDESMRTATACLRCVSDR